MDMASMLDASVMGRAEKPAIRYDGRSISYRELQTLSRKAAQVLHDAGVKAGDRIAVMTFNVPGFIIAAFGAWRLGAVIVPVNHKLQAPEVDYILRHSQVSVFIFDGALSGVATACDYECRRYTTAAGTSGIASFDEAVESADEGRFARVPGTTIAEVLYTSGTTGKPKGCLHTHSNLLGQALSVVSVSSITENERTLIAMPIWHSSPLNNWTLGTLLMGGTVVLLREYTPRAFLEIIQAERTTSTFCAPIALIAPAFSVPEFQNYDLSSMTRWIYGGGPIGVEMAGKLAAAYKSDKFIQVYGMTETGPLGTILHAYDAARKAGSIGRNAVPGLSMKVLLPDGEPAGPGEIGEIHFLSHAMMVGYLDDDEATRAAFTEDGWYKSGDLALVDEDGYLFIIDRLKDMIVTGGENVYSKEVEDALSSHPDIADVAVVGKPHPEWGETVSALIVPRDPGKTTEGELISYLQSRLAKYKIPRIFRFVNELPRTPSGKLQKHKIRESFNTATVSGETDARRDSR